MGRVIVLRLGHRINRDQRVTTHVALTARALGASEMVFSGDYDEGLISSVENVVKKWGGNFKISYVESWKRYLREMRERGAYVVHLTMYGINIPDVIDSLRRVLDEKDVVLVVGSSKTPKELFELSDINVAVTNQPHSEVAALAIMLDWLFEGKEVEATFPGAKIIIVPDPRRKVVLRP